MLEQIKTWLAAHADRQFFTVWELLYDFFGTKRPTRRGRVPSRTKSVAKCLRSLGWQSVTKRVDGVVTRVWVRAKGVA